MNILITGGAGFIGAHTAYELAQAGHKIVVIDDFNSFVYDASLKRARMQHFLVQSGITIVHGDILDTKLLADLIRQHSIETIIHLAAHGNAGQSVGDTSEYLRVNIGGTQSVLAASEDSSVNQLVFSSSSTVYDDTQTPFHEDVAMLAPLSPYGVTKLHSETTLRDWHTLTGKQVTILRFFSVYGPWGRPDMAPNIFLEHILNGSKLIITANRQRDYVYIDDAVAAITSALNSSFPFEIFNIGSGRPTSLEELAHLIGIACSKSVSYSVRESPPGEMSTTYADIAKAQRMLGYIPRVYIEEGVRRMVDVKTSAHARDTFLKE